MSATQIVESLAKLTDEELREVAQGLDSVFRERHRTVIDDGYGTLTEEDLAMVAGEAWDVIDAGKPS